MKVYGSFSEKTQKQKKGLNNFTSIYKVHSKIKKPPPIPLGW
jgi:hypothetical protein